MEHTSIPLDTPIEMVNIEPSEISPLISKCQIKVCYVSDKPNRNNTVITKEVATAMAPSLRGAAIVGHYSEKDEDFEEHNKLIEIKNNQFKIIEDTRPYGFVDLNANVWFQKFLDDDAVEREYLVTEGWLWTGQYPECQRIIDEGNNQSMELDNDLTKGAWTKFNNANRKFFIINEAIISKLCILGEKSEPCFEGSTITNAQFSLNVNQEFKNEMLSFMKQIKEILSEGGEKTMFNQYAVEIGNILWEKIYSYLVTNWPKTNDRWDSRYILEGIYEDEGQKFFVCIERENRNKFVRFDFNYTEDAFTVTSGPTEVVKEFNPQFKEEEIAVYALKFKEEHKDEIEQSPAPEIEDTLEDDNIPEESHEDEEIPVAYNLDEIPEYVQAMSRIGELEEEANQHATAYAALEESNKALQEELNSLREFKLAADRKAKQEMIDRFYMLSDENKADVVEHIDQYSLNDIEAKLSIICVRNKVSFAKDGGNPAGSSTYRIEEPIDTTPAWIKAVLETAKEM